MGARTVLETMIQGTRVSLLEMQLRIVHSLNLPQVSDQARAKSAGRIAFTTRTDLQSRHRLTMECTIGYAFLVFLASTLFVSNCFLDASW
jgi:hypothetical protein